MRKFREAATARSIKNHKANMRGEGPMKVFRAAPVFAWLTLLITVPTWAQVPPPPPPPPSGGAGRPFSPPMARRPTRTPPMLDFYRQAEGPLGPRISDYSWVYVPVPEPYEIKLHDIVTIIVDEKSETLLNSQYNRTRNGTFNAQLNEFIRLGADGNARPAAYDQPSIDTNLQSRLQSTGQATDTEGMRFRIAATVVDVLPNGNLVLEARRSIRTDDDLWQYTLTGTLRSFDINRDNTALSENIADLEITKNQSGKVQDSTHRPWGMYLYDKLFPF